MVVTNQDQYLLALRQLGTHQSSFVLEPVGRNTAPAIALACLMMDPEEIVLVTPSDHLIKKQAAYQEAVEKAVAFAKEGFLVTFGIQPTYAETGFGYIEAAGNEVLSLRVAFYANCSCIVPTYTPPPKLQPPVFARRMRCMSPILRG